MADTASKPTSLMMRLRDPQDAPAWREFVALYAPMIYRLARRHGLSDGEAADFTLSVLQTVPTAADRLQVDPGPGTFRGWMFGLVHPRLTELLKQQKTPTIVNEKWWTEGGQPDTGVPSPPDMWKEEHLRQLIVLAAEKAKAVFTGPAWQAFERTALLGRDQAEVAKELGTSVGSVHAARCRVQAKIQQLVSQAQAQE
jgi:RNA polymerase sigma factor (sigma-70 family)